MKKITLKKLLFSMLALAVPACGLTAADEKEADPRPIVVIDARNFKNKTDQPRANFRAMADRIAHEFVQTGVYRVMNIEDAEEALKKSEVFKVISDEDGKDVAIPRPAFSVKLVVVQYGVSQARTRDPLRGGALHQEAATVEVILSVVDLTTGETKISKNLPPLTGEVAAGARMGQVKRGNYREQALQAACRALALRTVREVVTFTPFNVVDVENGEITTDIPASVARPGEVFTVYQLGKSILIRRTGKRKAKEKAIGQIVLTACDEDTSTARPAGPVSGKITTKCILKRAQIAPPPPAPVGGAANPF